MVSKPQSVPRSVPMPANQDRAAGRIAKLCELPENWDGYGSPAISVAARDAALRIIKLPPRGMDRLTHIGPTPGGGLQVDFAGPSGLLETYVAADGTVEHHPQADAKSIP